MRAGYDQASTGSLASSICTTIWILGESDREDSINNVNTILKADCRVLL